MGACAVSRGRKTGRIKYQDPPQGFPNYVPVFFTQGDTFVKIEK